MSFSLEAVAVPFAVRISRWKDFAPHGMSAPVEGGQDRRLRLRPFTVEAGAAMALGRAKMPQVARLGLKVDWAPTPHQSALTTCGGSPTC